MTIYNDSTIHASGQLYAYDNITRLEDLPYASGVLCNNHRLGQNLGQARGYQGDPAEISLYGALAEVAFHVTFGDCLLPFDPFSGLGDDFKLINGQGGEIKCSASYSNLLVPEYQYERNASNPNYIYVAARQVSERGFRLIGWTTSKELAAKADRINPQGRGMALRLRREYLHPFKRLIGKPIEEN